MTQGLLDESHRQSINVLKGTRRRDCAIHRHLFDHGVGSGPHQGDSQWLEDGARATIRAMTTSMPDLDQPKRLTRSTSDHYIAGVSGGLGRYFDLDPALFRIAF